MRRTSTKASSATGGAKGKYSLDDQVGFLLRRAYQRASTNLTERIGQYHLTPPQFATLARLYERGDLSQNLLGRLVTMEPANIRDVVQRLKKRDLVATKRDATDTRLVVVSLTTKGRDLTRRLLPIEVACTKKTLLPLNSNERKTLYDLLHRVAGG